MAYMELEAAALQHPMPTLRRTGLASTVAWKNRELIALTCLIHWSSQLHTKVQMGSANERRLKELRVMPNI
jgi:hypothetical protein